MIEYNCWLNVRCSPDGEEEDDIEEIVEKIRDMFSAKKSENQYFNIVNLNYSYVLQFAGSHNHRDNRFENFLEMFNEVAKMAPGTFGLLYVWDDEDIENGNNFVVYRMAKSKIRIEKDQLLSPCNPVIED